MLRPLWLVLIAVTVLLALVTTSGRVLVAWLPQLEPRINGLLAGRGIEITGLEGSWHQLNPVVRAAQVRFGGGRATDVTLEVDVLESALHSALVVRHLSAAQVEVAPVRGNDGHWRVGNSPATPGGSFPLDDLLRYSDGMMFPDVRVRFDVDGPSGGAQALAPLGEIHASVLLANTGLRHSGEVTVGIDQGGRGSVRLAYNLADAWFGRPRNGEVAIDADQFAIDPALGIALGGVGATVDQLHGQWSFSGRNSTGELAFAAHDLRLPTGVIEAVDLILRGSTGRLGRRWDLAVDRLAVTSSHGAVRLDKTVVAVEKSLAGWSNIEVALPSFDAQPVIGVVRDAAAGVHGVEEWLGALAPRGRIDHGRMRFDIDDKTLSYAADVSDLALENAKGVPYVRNGKATVVGTERSVEIHLDGERIALGFLDYFDNPTVFDHLEGSVLIWFTPGYLAVQGRDLAGAFGASSVHGEFTFGRPPDPLEQRLFLALRLNDIDGREALSFVPRELPQALRDGLDHAIVAGQIDAADFVYHGHLRTIERLPMRQVELRVDLHDGVVRFHPDWPPATGVAGRIEYTARGTTGQFDAGSLAGIGITNANVFLPHSMEYVGYQGRGEGDGAGLRQLIDKSPLSSWLTFVKPEWTFSGPFDYTTDMKIPIAAGIAPQVDFHVGLKDLTAQLADMKLEFDALRGKVHYRYPNVVEAENLTGRLFGRPARFAVASADGQVRVSFDGRTSATEVTNWRGLPNPGLADGEFAFEGEYRIRPGSSEPAVLIVHSDLAGVTLSLPPPLAKSAEESRPTTLGLVFSDDHNRLDFQLGSVAQGWLRLVDGAVRGGSIGIGVEAAAERGDEDALMIEGSLDQLDLTDRLRGEEAGLYPSFPWGMNAFKIGRVTYRDTSFDNIVADVWNRAGDLQVSVTSPDVEGSMEWASDAPPRIDLHYLKLPAGPGGAADPLAGVDPRAIIDLDVIVESIALGEKDFGSWRFDLRKSEQGVAVEKLVADVKGLHIESTGDTYWSADDGGRTHFKGMLDAGDLATVLPQWNYAPSLETTSTHVDADVVWAGSPLNFALARIVGTLAVKAEKGRFVDLGEGSGAVRVFSLLNFAAIAKRMTLDFSDVFGKGISFDQITGSVMADRGVITFIEPMDIDGTGGDFRINGTVNLINGALDNEMVVTLPVSSSLPWYAAYLGFVNPIAAGAVLVGERLFRSQIDKMSSAKYKVTGTLQNPEVNFQEVFPKAMTEPTENASTQGPHDAVPSQTAPEPAVTQPPTNAAGATGGATNGVGTQSQTKDKDA